MYKLKITQDKKNKEQEIKDLKELKEVLETYKDKPIEVEMHKVKVYGSEK